MGCLSVTISKITQEVRVCCTLFERARINVTKAASAKIDVMLHRHAKINVTKNESAKMRVSLVCTTTLENGDEMWWCDGWRLLWNNGIKAMWRK